MLQENVREVISYMKQTQIKLFMLTGDKSETAINIAYNCGLVDTIQGVVRVDGGWRQILEHRSSDRKYIQLNASIVTQLMQ